MRLSEYFCKVFTLCFVFKLLQNFVENHKNVLLQTGAEDARFECARKMTELESRKRYEFLEGMVSSMDAHLRFFERGHEVTIIIGDSCNLVK